MQPMIVGALLNSALYLSAVFIAGMLTANGLAWKLAVAAMGVTYLSFLLQMSSDAVAGQAGKLEAGVTLFSILLGIAAGVALLV